ncbi:T9SS type A sorting domain-containing protein [Owenweeksia hongkongensis]|uniref:Secretion system C-terminal sorting domain-containing protein n=1 Tax=Owenweeksia hongkongensis (strain DSM 17368 / CIP 108786 / JCM 12287 / NRRL B-23963 / UST20020801) TaxID=926562 RepID=G8R5Z2_OWEHD|nr:T9SS type A sorting domain-containing protein [Owenweeksia hongkongensis]AEV31140.1 hypothetical protein Oweho_0118 [Owenweeksia hongkongensis DSM 17368]
MTKKIFTLALGLALSSGLMAQTISGITPATGNQGQTLPIIVSGQNTAFTQGSMTMFLSQGSYTIGQAGSGIANISIVNSTTISANLNVPGSAPVGFYDLYIMGTGSSTLNKTSAFEVAQPSGASVAVSPNGGQPGKAFSATFTVSGASFKSSAQQTIEKVWLSLNGEVITDITNISVVNATTFTADVNVPVGTTQGMWDVNVYTDDNMMYTSTASFDIDNTFSRAEYNNVDFKIYPNPVTTELTAVFETQYSDMDVQIFDLTGKAVSQYSYSVEVQENLIKVNTENLAKGSYTIQFISNDEVVAAKKLVRQ